MNMKSKFEGGNCFFFFFFHFWGRELFWERFHPGPRSPMTHNCFTTEDSLCWINTASSWSLTSFPREKRFTAANLSASSVQTWPSMMHWGFAGEITKLAPQDCFQGSVSDIWVFSQFLTHMYSSGLLILSHCWSSLSMICVNFICLLFKGQFDFPYFLRGYLVLTSMHYYRPILRSSFFFFFQDLFIYLREKESRGGSRGRGGEKESQTDSTLSMKPNVGLDPRTLKSWPEAKPRVRSSTDYATQGPHTLL